MRVIAGEFKGRPLKAPRSDTTRPTADRVREATMSSITSARGGFEGALVLDAFAGSGALGIEALSRGAAWSCFFETDRQALRALKANIEGLSLGKERFSLRNADILKHPPCDQRKPFDLVFLDPPYAYAPTRMLALLNAMAGAGSLLPGAFVCYEYARSADRAVQEAFEPLQWEPVSNKGYGDTSVRLFRLGNEMPA